MRIHNGHPISRHHSMEQPQLPLVLWNPQQPGGGGRKYSTALKYGNKVPRPTPDATEGGANGHQTEPCNEYEAPRYLPTPIRVGEACRGSHLTNLRKCKWREAPRGVEGNQRWNVYHWPNQKCLRGCSLLHPETSFHRWKGLRILLLGWAMKGPLKKKGKWG